MPPAPIRDYCEEEVAQVEDNPNMVMVNRSASFKDVPRGLFSFSRVVQPKDEAINREINQLKSPLPEPGDLEMKFESGDSKLQQLSSLAKQSRSFMDVSV